MRRLNIEFSAGEVIEKKKASLSEDDLANVREMS